MQIDAGNMATENVYLPGGTAMVVIGDAVGRLEPRGQNGDAMGRWSYIHLRRRGQPPVTIYTVYQVCLNPTNAIGHTAWHQQRLALNQQNRTSQHPRQAFISDLTASIKSFQALHHDIIIGGDFNETTDKHASGILKLINTTNLVDPFLHYHPTLPTFNTYNRGTQRIDAIFCSPSIIPTIKAIGYSPFNWVTNSDHRAIFVDFCSKKLFQDTRESSMTLSPPNTRAIRSNDKQRVQLYIEKFYKHLVSNNCAATLEQLNTNGNNDSIQIEKIDRLIGQAGDTAEKTCKRRRPEFYSHALNSQRIKTSIALGHLNNIRFNKNQDTSSFYARLDRAGIHMDLPSDQKEAYDLYTSLKTSLIEKSKMDSELREQHLQEVINARTPVGTTNHTRKVKAIKTKEAAKKAWKTLKFLKAQSGATQTLNRIDIPDSWPGPLDPVTPYHDLEDPKKCTQWRNISNPDEIEHYVRLRNRGHFGQAQGTPFTEVPLKHQINWQADTPTCEEILNGYHQIETIDTIPQCQSLLDACKVATELDLLPYEITEKDFEGKIKSWNESTTTSPSGRHLGRYKSLYTDVPQTDDEISPGDISIKAKQVFITRTIIAVINYCLRTGYVLERWKTIINTMIFKETGNYQIHRLRVIHIYEADFNLLLAVKWRQLLQSADMLGLINEGLFGGRPGCEAQSLTFLEELKYDISFMTRRTLFNFDNDATSCYDRIIVALASLINRKYGLHRKVTAVHASTLKQARFHLRTLTGISDQSYSHSIQFPIFGSGQGSGNSPGIWLFISSTLCDVHNSISHGASFTNPDESEQVSISMVGFVDDSTGTYNDFQPQEELPFETMMSNMQTDAQAWNDLLWCSGGKLELPKCSYHVLRFRFLPNGTPIPDLTMPATPLQIKDSETGLFIPIPAKQADDPHKTLGHWKAPCEKNNKTQLNALAAKAKQTTMLIATGAFSRYGTQLAYAGVYLSSLKYVLPQCYFDHKQLAKTEAKTAPIILAKLGFNRHTHLSIRYAPSSFAGCGMIPWWVLQSEGQLALFLKHWRTDTMISKTVRIATAWSQWQSGLAESFLTDTITPLPHLEARWFQSLRYGLQKADLTIQLNKTYVVPPERHGDVHIMQWASNSGTYSASKLKVLNYCRMHLHVTTISELFQIHTDTMLPYMYDCTRPKWFNDKQYMPRQPRPSSYQIRKIWKPFCDTWLLKIQNKDPSLGVTTGRATQCRPFRQSYRDETSTEKTIYHWISGSYWSMKPDDTLNNDTRHDFITTDQATTWKPKHLDQPVTLSIYKNTTTGTIFQVLLSGSIALPPNGEESDSGETVLHNRQDQPSAIPTTSRRTMTFRAKTPSLHFQEHVSLLQQWEKPILQNIHFAYDITHFEKQIRECHHKQQTLIAIVDQSSNTQNACYGWILYLSNGEAIAEGQGLNLGPASSPRAAAWGLLSISTFLHQILKYLKQPPTSLPPVRILGRNSKNIKYLQT